MHSFFEQAELHIEPENGSTFDVEAVAARVASLGYSFRDETDPAMFVIAKTEEARDTFRARRKEDPESSFPYVLLIRAEPGIVSVYQDVGGAYLEFSRDFVPWLLSQCPCRVRNESGTSLDLP